MTPEQLPFLAAGVLLVAFLYSSVGHAGASGYIAVMSLFSLAPAVIKPTALLLNILVASIGAWQFWRAGYFSWRLFWPFALLSIPAGGPLHRCRPRVALRPDGHRGRHLPDPAAPADALGAHQDGGGGFGPLHPRELGFRPARQSRQHPAASPAGPHTGGGRRHWRHCGLLFRQPPVPAHRYQAPPGRRPPDRWGETHLHPIGGFAVWPPRHCETSSR